MVTRIILIFFSSIILNPLYAQEEQRKYFPPNFDDMVQYIAVPGEVDGIMNLHHGTFTYLDIYLDTPDLLLHQSNYSLRLRKRKFNTGVVNYAMQLKSEMMDSSVVRLEIEEPELNFYKVKTNSGWQQLTTLLDVIYAKIDTSSAERSELEVLDAISEIEQWIIFKAGAPLTPFQTLRREIGIEEVSRLTPVMVGISTRRRSHLFVERDFDLEGYGPLPSNQTEHALTPSFFRENNQFTWVMESSLDRSVFLPLRVSSNRISEVFEYEVENKYFLDTPGRQLMERYERALKRHFDLIVNTESKYSQAIGKLLTQ